MELLLNLFWLLLALIALAAGWMAGSARGVSRLRRFVLIGCISLLFFPILSASDDLRAMATECEDSTVSKSGSPKHAKFRGTNCANDALASSGANAGDLIPPSDASGEQVRGFTYQLSMQGSARPMACRPPPGPNSLVLVASVTVATQHRLGATSPLSDGVEAAHAAAEKQRCLDLGELHGEHGVTNRADDFGNPLRTWQRSSTT